MFLDRLFAEISVENKNYKEIHTHTQYTYV